jgi:hypothetical protein
VVGDPRTWSMVAAAVLLLVYLLATACGRKRRERSTESLQGQLLGYRFNGVRDEAVIS